MSASMVKKSLIIIDSDFGASKGKQNKNRLQETNKITKVKNKDNRNIRLSTLIEARQNYKSKEEILKLNLNKLQLVNKACAVELDPLLTKQFFTRAITKKPTSKTDFDASETVFTEKDFTAFEADYIDE